MHKKGISGIRLGYLAALAFLFAIAGQALLCGAMLLVAIFVEKDEWLSRQALQALLLRLVFQAISWIFSGIYSGLAWLDFFSIFSNVFGVIEGICFLLLCLLGIIGIYNVLKDKEADLPVLSGIAYKAYGKVRPVYTAQNPMQYPQQHTGAPHYNYPPVRQQTTMPQPPVQPPVQQDPPVQPQPPVQQPTPSYTAPPPPAPPVQTPPEAPNPPLDQRPDQPAE